MVSKIAVMALVVIVAAPILIGYGMNIETQSYTDWVDDGKEQDMTNYLTSVVDASKRNYTDADLYQFNSKIFSSNAVQVYPNYQSISTTKTPIWGNLRHITPSLGSYPLPAFPDLYSQGVVDGGYDASNYITFTITSGGNTYSYSHIKAWEWISTDGVTASISFSLTEPGDYVDGGYDVYNITSISNTVTGDVSYWLFENAAGQTHYADISKGYRLNVDMPTLTSPIANILSYYGHGLGMTGVYPDGICKDMVLTFDLNTITDSSYYMAIRFPSHYVGVNYYASITLQKRTVDGNAQWFYTTYGDNTEHPLYYNPALSSNTYQLYLDGNDGGEFRYVGVWSDSIRQLPALKIYSFEYTETGWIAGDYIHDFAILGRTPVMRVDYAQVAAYEYRIIRDTTYNPADFKDNPSTTLSNIAEYGTSLEFGGQTYAVTDGKITVDGKTVLIRNLQLSSVFTGSGYDNRINGMVVSSSVTPSDIVFNGDWSMVVKTVSQKSIQKDETKWIPGHFAWQGVDDNFIMAGLITSLGAFIALAVYARSSRKPVWPLLIVCGGAAFMFFLMI